MIDSNESVVNWYRYTPFGQSMVKNESVYNPYQYTGRRYDEERGNYYYRARIYDQQQSRFLSNDVSEFHRNSKYRWNCSAIPVDPVGQGANLYAYVGNNPTNRRDPSGTVYIGGPGSPPPRLIDGSAGSAACPKSLTYESMEDCRNSMQYWDDPNRQEMCKLECYTRIDPDTDVSLLSCEQKVGILCAGASGGACWAAAIGLGMTTGPGGLAVAVICAILTWAGCNYVTDKACN